MPNTPVSSVLPMGARLENKVPVEYLFFPPAENAEDRSEVMHDDKRSKFLKMRSCIAIEHVLKKIIIIGSITYRMKPNLQL